MDQDSTGKGSGGDRRNWRERLGINKDLPRLSEEFKTEKPAQRAEPQLGRAARPPERPAGQPPGRPQLPPAQQRPAAGGPAGESSRPTGQRPGPEVVRPAPMAPRPAGRVAPMAPRPAARPQRPPAPAAPAPAPAQAQRPPASEAPQRPTPSLTTGERSDKFAERLKEQREAAERLARQRMEQARAQALSSQHKPVPPPAPAPASPSTAEEEKPKFTFAKEEIDRAQREGEPPSAQPPRAAPPPPPPSSPPPSPGYGYQPPAQPYGRVPPPVYQPGVYQPGAYQPGGYQPGGYQGRPYPPEQGAPQPYRGPAPVQRWENEAPVDDQAGAAPEDEIDDERGAPPPARGQVAQRPRARAYAEDDLEDVFDEDERAPRRGRRARAEDYSAAYRTYEDEFEDAEEEPRSRGGPLVLLLALIALALIAGGVIYWYFSQNRQTARQGSNVPVITAPKEPAKTVPQASNQQQSTKTPAQQPAHHKKIYDRILGDETLEPERIVPTEETPKTPLPAQNQSGKVPDNGSKQQQKQPQSIDQLPLPLPPPPEPSGQQGKLDVPQTTGKSEPQQMTAQNETVVAKPAAETAVSDLAVSKSDMSSQNSVQDLKVPEVPTAEAAQKQVEVAAKQADTTSRKSVTSGDQQQLQQIIETDQPAPKPEPKPQKPKLAAKPKPQQRVAVAPPPPQPQQPAAQESGPIAITPFNAPTAQSTQPPQNQAAQQPDTATETTTQFHGRDSDPLAGKRVPFSSSLPQTTLSTQQPSDLALPGQQPAPQQQQPVVQPQQQQVASIPPQPKPEPQPQQPSAASGYVVQLAAFRSQADAQNEYQRISQAHARLLHGLSPLIQQASLGAAGSFYRLSVGTLPSAQAAQKLCNALISAGERDCLVRRQ